ncbi:hypothetical protein ACQ86G_19350 [Roseateles chitinivorans]|uniref:hypothetical protein n=1 Tax=Roseateles chitinivorans TaxID=2917965 RepID=UPI003D664086
MSFRWLGHAAALIFWSATMLLLLVKTIFGSGTGSEPVKTSPSGRYVLVESLSDPGAMGTARQGFALRRGRDGPVQAFVDLKASPAVAAIGREWTAESITLNGVPASSLRRIVRSGDPTQRMALRFGADQ